MSFAKKFVNKYGKKLMDTAIKTGMEAAKIGSKRVVQKTAETTGGLIGNKIADKITSIVKLKEKEKEKPKLKEIYIPPERRQQIINDLRLFSLFHKNGISKIFLTKHLMIKIFQNLLLKNGLKSIINQKEIIAQEKKLESKHQC